MAGWVDCSSSFATPSSCTPSTRRPASSASTRKRSDTQPTPSLKQLRLFSLDKAPLVTPRSPGSATSARRPATQTSLDRSLFTAQNNPRLINWSSKGKARDFAVGTEVEEEGKSRARLLNAGGSAVGRKENIGHRAINSRASQLKPGPTLTFDGFSSPPGLTNEEIVDEESRRRKRRLQEGGPGQLDLVPAPDFDGFGGSPLDITPAKRRRKRGQLEMSSSSPPMLGLVHPAYEDENDRGGEDLRIGEQLEPLSLEEPDTMDQDEVAALMEARPSVSTTEDADEARAIQAALVGDRKQPASRSTSASSGATVLVPDSDEEEGLDVMMANEVTDVVIVDSDEDEQLEALARRATGADDSGFAEIECDEDDDETQPLESNEQFAVYKQSALPERVHTPVLAPEPISTPSSGSLGRSESSILMPPPPLPPRKSKDNLLSPARVLVEDTQSQLQAQAVDPPSPSRVLVDETQRRPTGTRKSITEALQEAWAGQLPPPPRQAGIAEFFALQPREPRASQEDEEMVIEDSQRVPSLGEQVAAAAMLRDVRASRQRLAQEAQRTPTKRVLTSVEQDDEVEDPDTQPLVPSSQPRADECGVGLSPLKTPSKERIFTPPKHWPRSPSTRGPPRRKGQLPISSGPGSSLDDGETKQIEELEELETQWESYWTLASPSASLLDQFGEL